MVLVYAATTHGTDPSVPYTAVLGGTVSPNMKHTGNRLFCTGLATKIVSFRPDFGVFWCQLFLGAAIQLANAKCVAVLVE
eukprot:763711-Rhodomonas_salina.1